MTSITTLIIANQQTCLKTRIFFKFNITCSKEWYSSSLDEREKEKERERERESWEACWETLEPTDKPLLIVSH